MLTSVTGHLDWMHSSLQVPVDQELWRQMWPGLVDQGPLAQNHFSVKVILRLC